MSRIRVILAGIVGGIAMFMGGFLTHGVLHIDAMFMHDLPKEDVVISAISDTVSQRGWYVFPAQGKAMSKSATDADKAEFMEKLKKGPTATVIYNPTGVDMSGPTVYLTELVSNIALCMILSAVLVRVSGSKPTRIALATMLGVAAWMAIDVSYWNWDRFPDTYALAGLIDQGVGWFMAGTAITLVLGKHVIAARINAQS